MFTYFVPPVVFCFWCFFGYFLKENMLLANTIQGFFTFCCNSGVIGSSTGNLLSIFSLGIVLVALGFLLSNVTIIFLRFIFIFCRKSAKEKKEDSLYGNNFEVFLSEDTRKKIIDIVGIPNKADELSNLPIATLYMNEKFAQPLQNWLDKRWQAYMILSSCITGVILAFILMFPFSLWSGLFYFWCTLVVCGFLFINALITRKQLFRVIELAAQRKFD